MHNLINPKQNIHFGDTAFLDTMPLNGGEKIQFTIREGRVPRASVIIDKDRVVGLIKALVQQIGGTVRDNKIIQP